MAAFHIAFVSVFLIHSKAHLLLCCHSKYNLVQHMSVRNLKIFQIQFVSLQALYRLIYELYMDSFRQAQV